MIFKTVKVILSDFNEIRNSDNLHNSYNSKFT